MTKWKWNEYMTGVDEGALGLIWQGCGGSSDKLLRTTDICHNISSNKENGKCCVGKTVNRLNVRYDPHKREREDIKSKHW